MLVDVGFNKEVAEDAALYWSRKDGDLANLINKADKLRDDEIVELGEKARKRVRQAYTWEIISSKYEEAFLKWLVELVGEISWEFYIIF